MSLGSMDGAMLGLNDDSKWRKCGPSRTGTSCILDCDVSRSGHIPDLQLVWRGNEALDKLHISMQVIYLNITLEDSRTLRQSPICLHDVSLVGKNGGGVIQWLW